MEAGKCVLIAVFAIILLPAVQGLDIDLSVSKVLSAHVTNFGYEDSTKMFEIEILNNGSLPYAAQARITVSGSTGFTAWSPEVVMMPGDNKVFEIYSPPYEADDHEAILRLYYGNEIMEERIDISVSEAETEDIFGIGNVRVFDNYIAFAVTAEEDTEAAVFAGNYPAGWIFTQSSMTLRKNLPTRVLITYTPSAWSPADISLYVVSKDGRYATMKQIRLEREKGLEAFLNNVMFNLLKSFKENKALF